MITSFARSEVQPYLLGQKVKAKALLENPAFLLLYVPDDGGKMRLVRPAADPKLQSALQKPGKAHQLNYNALSHLWGISNEKDKKNYMWDVGKFIQDENGDPAQPIPMREEKRQTLLVLLREQPGYWWIDVLCARVNTPLGIMGSIYMYCDGCFAMIDCAPRYMQMVKDGTTSQIIETFAWFGEMKVSKQETRYKTFVEKWSLELLLMREVAHTPCRWLKRVWTLQEATLPAFIYILPETGSDACWMKDFMPLSDLTFDLSRFQEILMTIDDPDPQLQPFAFNQHRFDNEISDVWHHRFELRFQREVDLSAFVEAVEGIGLATRECMDPVDYVYGVLGIFDLNVARMKDHQAVWSTYLAELEGLIRWLLKHGEPGRRNVRSISISDKAYHINLSKVKNMAEVYSGLLDVTYYDN